MKEMRGDDEDVSRASFERDRIFQRCKTGFQEYTYCYRLELL